MVDNPQQYPHTGYKPIPYTEVISRAMNMDAIVRGLIPGVVGWQTTVSDTFMYIVGGGQFNPAIMEYPIRFDGLWTPQLATYWVNPIPPNYTYGKGVSQPDPQALPTGYRAKVTKISIEVAWANGVGFPPHLYDPADYMRWFWKKNGELVRGANGPVTSRTIYGNPSFDLVAGIAVDGYDAVAFNGVPPAVKVTYTLGTNTPYVAGQTLVFAGGGSGVVEGSIKTGGAPGAEVGFVILRSGTVSGFNLLTGAITPSSGTQTATAGVTSTVQQPVASPMSYQQIYFYPQADLPPIFLDQGDISYLRIENYTNDPLMVAAVSICASGVMWPLFLEQ